jgi:transmembrane sensor
MLATNKATRVRTFTPTWQKVAACLLFAAIIAAGGMWWLSPRAVTYETRAGELHTVKLPDGSTIQMNARSRIQSEFTARERTVDLIAGEALFSVAKDAERPFTVRSDSTRVRALGTQFDVYRKDSGSVITVVQGAVSVDEVLVYAGEQATTTAHAPTQVHAANAATAIAWTEGQLVFDSTPLRDVAAELNRVGTRRLLLEDNSILNLHITGVFPANDPAALITFLRARFGVTVEETDQEIRLKN